MIYEYGRRIFVPDTAILMTTHNYYSIGSKEMTPSISELCSAHAQVLFVLSYYHHCFGSKCVCVCVCGGGGGGEGFVWLAGGGGAKVLKTVFFPGLSGCAPLTIVQ